MRIVALSDTHSQHREVSVPDGDVLVFAGDLMTCGRKYKEVVSFADWFVSQPHPRKILIAGNHDRLFETQLPMCVGEFHNRIGGEKVSYLQDSGVTINGINFWGSPWQPFFMNWAFNEHRGEAIKRHWDKIPSDTDVLITHGPPMGILDQMISTGMESNWGSKLVVRPSEHLGCEELRKAVDRINPKVHVFGHIHGSYGMLGMMEPYCRSYNVSVCDELYQPVNPVTVIEV